MGGDIRVVRERVDDTNVRITSLSQEVEALREAVSAMPAMTAPTDRPTAAGLARRSGESGDPWRRQCAGAPARRRPAPAPPAPAAWRPRRRPRRPVRRPASTTWRGPTTPPAATTWRSRASPATCARSRKSEFADNAQYYIGESYFQRGRLAEAVEAFARVISTYPHSDVVGQAYYKRGLSYERLNQPDRAREPTTTTSIKTAADSDAGRLAKQRLDALNRARPQ